MRRLVKDVRRSSRPARRTPIFESLEPREMLSADYYVSASLGSTTGTGAQDQPWKTIQQALNAVPTPSSEAGRVTIHVDGGVYSESIKVAKPYVTLVGDSGEDVRIVAPSDNSAIYNAVTLGAGSSHAKLINLDISGGYYYALKAESTWKNGASTEYGASDILISNSKLHDSGRDVVKLVPLNNNITIEKSEIYNSGRRDPSNAEGIDGVNADNFILRDSYIHDTATNGVYLKGGSINTLIERNRITATGYHGIILGQSTDRTFFDRPADGTYYESRGGTVRNNIVWNTGGAGISAWAAKDAVIHNNTLVNVGRTIQGGIYIANEGTVPSTNVTLVNNLVEVDSSLPVVKINAAGLNGAFVHSNNRYFRASGGAIILDERISSAPQTLAAWKAAIGDQTTTEGPLGVDAFNGYRLVADSPAIDAGTAVSGAGDFNLDFDGESRPVGAAWDIGADEYLSGPSLGWRGYGFTTQRGDFELSFDVTPAAGADVTYGISNGAATSLDALATAIRLDAAAGMLQVRDGNAFVDAMAIAPGTSYHITFRVSTGQSMYQVVVTPQGGSATALGGGRTYAFASTMTGATALNTLSEDRVAGSATASGFVVAAADTPRWTNTPFASSSGTFEVAFNAIPTSYNEDVVIGLSRGSATAITSLAVIVRFNQDGLIDARNGGAYASQAPYAYQPYKGYRIRMVVNVSRHTYDVYVTGPDAQERKIAAGYAFRTEQRKVSSLSNLARYNEIGDADMDSATLNGSPLPLAPNSSTPFFSTSTATALPLSEQPTATNAGHAQDALGRNAKKVI